MGTARLLLLLLLMGTSLSFGWNDRQDYISLRRGQSPRYLLNFRNDLPRSNSRVSSHALERAHGTRREHDVAHYSSRAYGSRRAYASIQAHGIPEKHCIPPVSIILHTYKNNRQEWKLEVNQVPHKKNPEKRWRVSTITDQCDDVDCQEDPFFIANITIQPPIRKPLPPGYELLGGVGYYKFHVNPKEWLDALLTCYNDGGHLAIINSVEEAHVLTELLNQQSPSLLDNAGVDDHNYALLGFHDFYGDGGKRVFLTLDGIPITDSGFTTWSAGEPNNAGGEHGGEHCGGMNRDGGLDDIWCYKANAFICEIDL